MPGADEVFQLARDFDLAASLLPKVAADVFEAEGEQTADEWAGIARSTAGAHGVHYPDSITSEPTFAGLGVVGVEMGPESSRPQGGMGPGFEFGSVNQPPHMDGLTAMMAAEPRLEAKAADEIGDVLP